MNNQEMQVPNTINDLIMRYGLDKLEEKLKAINEKVNKDTGWETATLSSSFHAYNDNSSNTPIYRRVGKIVQIRGVVAPTSQIAAGSTTTIFTLPSGHRPSQTMYQICQGSGANRWLLSIETSGEVRLSRYGTTSDSAVSTSAWLPFCASWITDQDFPN